MAETELSALSRQCLDRRIDAKKIMEQEMAVWEQSLNEACTRINCAIHHRQCPHQAQAALPLIRDVTEH